MAFARRRLDFPFGEIPWRRQGEIGFVMYRRISAVGAGGRRESVVAEVLGVWGALRSCRIMMQISNRPTEERAGEPEARAFERVGCRRLVALYSFQEADGSPLCSDKSAGGTTDWSAVIGADKAAPRLARERIVARRRDLAPQIAALNAMAPGFTPGAIF